MQTTKWEEAAKQQQEAEQVHQRNVTTFVKMFFGLGADCLKLGGNRHDQELLEAKAVAAARWEQLLNIEQQVVREEQAVAARPRKRPPAPGDDMLATEVIRRLELAFEEESKGRRDGLEVLKAQAKREREELEAFITKAR